MNDTGLPVPDPAPDDERLAALLDLLKPRPTERFYRRMASAPWRQEAAARRLLPGRWGTRRIFIVGTLMFLLAVLAVFTTPSLAVFARQLMRFFSPHPDNTMVLQVTVPSPGDPDVFGTAGYFSLNLDEAEALAGYPAKEIPILEASAYLPGLELTGAHYDPDRKAVILRYSVDGRSLFFSQRLSGAVQEYSTVGANAPVEPVSVRGVDGEYVAGGWKTDRAPGGTSQPGTQVSLDVTWDPSLPQRILRWQEGDYEYEILVSAALGRAARLEKETLIEIANLVR